LNTGLQPKPALALARAGYWSLADLEGATWERLCALPGVGPASLEVLEEVLGNPLPRERKKRKAPPPAVWPEHVWRRRGLPSGAAITFVQMKMTVERLKAMNRQELLALEGVGLGTVRACELIIGRAIPSDQPAVPAKDFWVRQGLRRQAARALSAAGIQTPENLREVTREELLALRGFGEAALGWLEGFLGREFPSRTAYWLERGLFVGAANALGREGISTLEELGALTREELLSFPGIGYLALRQCEKLLGRMLPFQRREAISR
jgi:hypothetical protein